MGRERVRGVAAPPSDVEILRAVGRAFQSAADHREAIRSALRLTRQSLGSGPAEVILCLPDRAGRLRPVAQVGACGPAGRDRAAARRRAFLTRVPTRISPPDRAGWEVVLVPLVAAGRARGVLDVAAPDGAIGRRWESVHGVARHIAAALRELGERARLESEVEAAGDEGALMQALLRARTTDAIARAAVRYCARRLGVPAAAWVTREDGTIHELATQCGCGREAVAALRDEMVEVSRWETLEQPGRREAMLRFARIVASRSTAVLHARDLLVFLGGSSPALRRGLERIRPAVEDATARLETIRSADRRSRRIDLGLAWTAHELRSPLLGARAAIERLILDHDEGANGNGHHIAPAPLSLGPFQRELLLRSWQDLDELARQVESLLRWGVGEASLRRRRTDLAHVVHQAVRDASRAEDAGRVSVSSSGEVRLLADGDSLRFAVANLVRNALAYSPQDSPVAVRVHRREGVIRVSVKDRGTGVAHGEQDSIFDPFVRGGTGRRARAGNGLGLFIARRVVEAHGGAVRVESNGTGATFHIELPAKVGRWSKRALAS